MPQLQKPSSWNWVVTRMMRFSAPMFSTKSNVPGASTQSRCAKTKPQHGAALASPHTVKRDKNTN